jgi:hypothetical protein
MKLLYKIKYQLHMLHSNGMGEYLRTANLKGHTVTDLINSLPGNSSVNTVQHATIDEAGFYVVGAEQ